jgi:hypothetical protein
MTDEIIAEANALQGTPSIQDLEAQLKADEAARETPETEVVQEVDEEEPEVVKNDEIEEYEKRIARLGFREREATRNALRLEEENARLRGAAPANKDEDMEQAIERRAIELSARQRYNDKANAIAAKGIDEFPDFHDKLAAFREVGGISPSFVEAADEAGDAHKIIHYLGRNLDEADRIMKLSPASMGAALAKLSSKLTQAPLPKKQSNAPAPIKPINGKAKAEQSDEDMPIADYMRKEEAKLMTRRYGRA